MQKRTSILTWALGLFAVAALPFADAGAQGQPVLSRQIVLFHTAPGPADIALVKRAGGRVDHHYSIIPGLAIAVPSAAIPGLLNNPRVAEVIADGRVQANSELTSAWGVNHLNAGTIHGTYGVHGGGVKVAVIDTGVDYTHPDLARNYRGGYDFVNDDADPMDDHWHGTHVAGSICAVADGAGVIGMAPCIELYACKVLAADGSGYDSDIIAAIDWCASNGINITNNSYGGGLSNAAADLAFSNAAAAGVLSLASAGNSGNSKGKGKNTGYPSKYASVVAIAATGRDDNNDGVLDSGTETDRAPYSSTGPEVELCAPGTVITSTVPGGGYGTASGTSMACPHAVGAAALVWASGAVIDGGDTDTHIVNEVRARLVATADDLGTAGHDWLYGYGMVDPDEAIPSGTSNAVPTAGTVVPTPGSTTIAGVGDSVSFSCQPDDGGGSVAVTWWSSQDGVLSSSAGFSTTTLSEGAHTIVLRLTDANGGCTEAVCTAVIGNTPPTVTITAPSSGAGFDSGATVTLTGTASDLQDTGLDGSSISWSSDVDGSLGTGASVAANLSDGVHTITASVTDSGGAVGTATITIAMGELPMEGTVVTDRETTDSSGDPVPGEYGNREFVYITVTATGAGGSPAIEGATVTVRITTPKGTVYSGTAATAADGTVTFSFKTNTKRDQTGAHTVTAEIVKTGYETPVPWPATTFNTN